MVNENIGALGNRCYCLFDCQCEEVEKLIRDWTSLEALDTVKCRLLSLSDPKELFARLACMLFYREILDGIAVKSTKDNLRKAVITFSFAASFANEENDCLSFFTSCWQRFQQLASIVDEKLSHFTIRRRLPLICFVDEVFSLESADSTIAPTLAAEVQDEQIVGQSVQLHSDFTPETPLEEVHSLLDHSIPVTVRCLDTREVEGSANNSEENISQTLPPLISTIVDALSLDLTDDFQPMLSLDSNELNHAPSQTSEVANQQNADEFDDLDDPALDEEKPPADLISMPGLQNENVSNKRVVERSASKEEKKKPKMETPVAANGLESADKKVTEPKEEPEEVAEPCHPLNETTSQPCENVQTKIMKRSESRKERVGEPEKKMARPVVVAADRQSSSEYTDLHTSSRPSMLADSQSPQEPMEQSEDVVAEADVRLSNTSRPRRTRRARTAMIAVDADDSDGQPAEKRVSARPRDAENRKSARKSRTAMIVVDPDDSNGQPKEKRVSGRSSDAENCKGARKLTKKATTFFMLKFWYEKGNRPLFREAEELSKKSKLTINQVQNWFGGRRKNGVPNETFERSMLSTGRCENTYFEFNTPKKIDNAALLLKEFYKMIGHPFPSKTQLGKIATTAGLPQRKVRKFFQKRCAQLRAHVNRKSATVSKQLTQFNISEEQLVSFDWIRNKQEQRSTDSRTFEMLCRFYAVNMNSDGKVMPGDIPESTRSLLEQLTGWAWKKTIREWFKSKQRYMSGKSLEMLRSIGQLIRHPHEFRCGVGRNAKFDYFEDRYVD